MGVGIAFGEEYVGIMAFIGAMVISFGVLIIANMGGRANAIKLLLAGMALSAVCSAFTSIIVYFANDKEGIQNVTFWMMGSLAGANWGFDWHYATCYSSTNCLLLVPNTHFELDVTR